MSIHKSIYYFDRIYMGSALCCFNGIKEVEDLLPVVVRLKGAGPAAGAMKNGPVWCRSVWFFSYYDKLLLYYNILLFCCDKITLLTAYSRPIRWRPWWKFLLIRSWTILVFGSVMFTSSTRYCPMP